MRPVLLCATLLFVAACAPDPVPNPPPAGRFYFPTGIAFEPGLGVGGVLFVASSNFDKRFDRGALTMVPLGAVVREDGGQGLPPLGEALADNRPAIIQDLNIGGEQLVDIQSFAGDVGLYRRAGGVRAFVASRAERGPLQFVDTDGVALSCGYAPTQAPRDCFSTAQSLLDAERSDSALPRAPAPASLFVAAQADGGAEVFVGHMLNADSPFGSKTNEDAYIVHTRAEDPNIVESTDPREGSFISIGAGGTSGLFATSKWIFATGRYVSQTNGGQLVRMVNRADPSKVFGAGLESVFHSTEARGIAVYEPEPFSVDGGTTTDAGTATRPVKASDGRIFLAAREPDVLLVADATGLGGDTQPTLRIIRQVPLPDNPNDVKVIPRPSSEFSLASGLEHGPLVVVTCSGDDSVIIYDDDIGAVVARLAAGDQPYAVAVQRVDRGARIFVTNFADGRVAVIEIADLLRPHEARIVAHLGRSQRCIVNGRQSSTECQNEPL